EGTQAPVGAARSANRGRVGVWPSMQRQFYSTPTVFGTMDKTPCTRSVTTPTDSSRGGRGGSVDGSDRAARLCGDEQGRGANRRRVAQHQTQCRAGHGDGV